MELCLLPRNLPHDAYLPGSPESTESRCPCPMLAIVHVIACDLLCLARALRRAPGELDILLDPFPLFLSPWFVPAPCTCERRRAFARRRRFQ
jgi:hypothetical protein